MAADLVSRYKYYVKQAQDYSRAKQAVDPAFISLSGASNPYDDTSGLTDYIGEYFKSLSPEQLQEYEAGYQASKANDAGSLKGRLGQLVKGAAIGGPILGGLAATGALGAGAQGLASGAPLSGGAAGIGSSVGFGTPEAAGLLGSAVSGGGMDLGGLLGGLGSVKDWGSLLTGGAGLLNSLKSPAIAKTPDYTQLAMLQAQLDQQAADKTLVANRPNQVDMAGNTSNWTRDPTTGQWTQTQKLSGANQQLLDTSQQAQIDALRGVAGRGDFNFQGDPLMDPVGNSSDIQNAWMNLLKPERTLARNGEIQRLKNQGLTEDSEAFQRAMLRLDQGDTDAQNKALIYGTQEYGNQFGRSLNSRQQGFGEYQTDYAAPMQQYQGLMGIAAPSGQFGSFTTGANPGGANVYGAGQDQYAANVANANVKNATNNNVTQGLFGLSGNIAKGGWGA